MGRLVFLVIFFGAFIIFAIVKAVGSGVSTAYRAVFDPEAKEAQGLLVEIDGLVTAFLSAGSESVEDRRADLAELVSNSQNAAQRHGFALDVSQVKDVLAIRFAARGLGPDYKIRTALDFV